MKTHISIIAFLLTLSTFGQKIVGRWSGNLKFDGGQLNIVLNIKKTENGYTSTMDSPYQNAYGIRVPTTHFENSILKFEIPGGTIQYTGTLKSGTTIIGTFTQGGKSNPLNLFREKYLEEKVILETKQGNLHGSFLYNKSIKKQPLVIFHSGSGPTDRNSNQPPTAINNAIKLLAESLFEQNIASIRYDKRGVGQSRLAGLIEKDLRFDHYINDLKLWIGKFSKDERFSKIIIIGHSEGASIGLLASLDNVFVNKFISIAGISGTIADILKVQLNNLPEKFKTKSYSILESLEKGEQVNDVPKELFNVFRPSVQPYLISYLKYKPSEEIIKLTCPTLIIQGDNDLQVGVENANNLAAAQPKAKKVIIKGMTHDLKKSSSGEEENIATKYNPNLPVDSSLVTEIVSFIKK